MSVAVAWSGGKDAAWALHLLRLHGAVVSHLLVTHDERTATVPIHDVPLAELRSQAARTGVPLVEVPLPHPCTNAVYEARMHAALAPLAAAGVSALAFGDLFLADVRAFRERLLAPTGLQPRFPLWGRDTAALAAEMMAGGLEARIVAVDTARLDAGLVGRSWDAAFVAALPPGTDPCGERGEFHTFVTAGPMLAPG